MTKPADHTFDALVAALEDRQFNFETIDRNARVLVADSNSNRGWFLSLLTALTLGLVGQSESIRVTARVDQAGEDAILAIEARQLYGWPAPYDFSRLVAEILKELSRRLDLGETLL